MCEGWLLGTDTGPVLFTKTTSPRCMRHAVDTNNKKSVRKKTNHTLIKKTKLGWPGSGGRWLGTGGFACWQGTWDGGGGWGGGGGRCRVLCR